MKFGSVVRVETLRHLTKITALWRKASKNKVLAAKHTASLQLPCTVGGNQASLVKSGRKRGDSADPIYYGSLRLNPLDHDRIYLVL